MKTGPLIKDLRVIPGHRSGCLAARIVFDKLVDKREKWNVFLKYCTQRWKVDRIF